MSPERLIDSLERFAGILPVVVTGVSSVDARWRPPVGGWSVLEIVSHLADEETEDFRKRLDLTLREPRKPWPPIDPEGWAVERRYNEGELLSALDRFVRERRESVGWLRRLPEPDWSRTHHHRQLGPFRAGDILASWASHDLLHLKQITKRFYQIVQRDSEDYQTRYAGSWST